MIAEAVALDSGVVTVGAVAGLLLVVAGGAAWAATTTAALRAVAKDVSSLVRSMRDMGREHDDHRVEDDARHGEQGRRLDRLELLQDLTPIHGIPVDTRAPTGKHDRLRGDTPRPRRREETGETGSGESR